MTTIDKLFSEDERRSELANRKEIKSLALTYKTHKRLKNLNTGEFWDKKFNELATTRDFMSEDRISSAAEFIPKTTRKLLNIGVGKGQLEALIKGETIKLHGIDIAKHTIKNIQNQIVGRFIPGSIYKIPFNKKFDTVVALEVIEHLPAWKVFKAYSEIKRVLKQNGKVIFSVPVFEKYTSDFNPNAHLRRYTPELFKAELILAGFAIEREKKFFAFSNFYKVKTFIAKYILKNKWKPNVILVRAIKQPKKT